MDRFEAWSRFDPQMKRIAQHKLLLKQQQSPSPKKEPQSIDETLERFHQKKMEARLSTILFNQETSPKKSLITKKKQESTRRQGLNHHHHLNKQMNQATLNRLMEWRGGTLGEPAFRLYFSRFKRVDWSWIENCRTFEMPKDQERRIQAKDGWSRLSSSKRTCWKPATGAFEKEKAVVCSDGKAHLFIMKGTKNRFGKLSKSSNDGLEKNVACVEWSKGGDRPIAMGSFFGTVSVADAETFTVKRRMRGGACISCLETTEEQPWLLCVGTVDGWARWLDLRNPRDASVQAHQRSSNVLSSIAIKKDGGFTTALGWSDGVVSIFDSRSFSSTKTTPHRIDSIGGSYVARVAWCPWEKELLAISSSTKRGGVCLWSQKGGRGLSFPETSLRDLCLYDSRTVVSDVAWCESARIMIVSYARDELFCSSWRSTQHRHHYDLDAFDQEGVSLLAPRFHFCAWSLASKPGQCSACYSRSILIPPRMMGAYKNVRFPSVLSISLNPSGRFMLGYNSMKQFTLSHLDAVASFGRDADGDEEEEAAVAIPSLYENGQPCSMCGRRLLSPPKTHAFSMSFK